MKTRTEINECALRMALGIPGPSDTEAVIERARKFATFMCEGGEGNLKSAAASAEYPASTGRPNSEEPKAPPGSAQ
jgi:hypothetical protein